MTLSVKSFNGPIKRLTGPSDHPKLKGSNKTDSVSIVAFDRESDAWGIFSNYAETPIRMMTPYGERTFPTVEHYFQYQKDPNDKAYLNEILSGDAQNARNVGQKKKWNHYSDADRAMERAIDAKLKIPGVQNALLATGDACLIEDTGSRSDKNQDGNWGWKKGGQVAPHNGAGNKLGILLMEKRNLLNSSSNVEDPRDLSERARGIMTHNYAHTDLISLSKSLPDSTRAYSTYNHQNNNLPHSNQELSKVIYRMGKMNKEYSGIPLVERGAMNGALKIAFDSPEDANEFQTILAKEGFKTTYFGGNDKYPIDCGNGKNLEHIVRFENDGLAEEIPAAALEFLKRKFSDDDEKIADIVQQLGFESAELRSEMQKKP
ncbi:DUF1768 domain-containing protein [Legionella sp. MW5194]|uniref:NADAR family protein n=1 Tax=Legionella sp. MW5194 TaxID=2662448 RepID=UPI00193CFBC7|nr:NADAR family protein [Legionella sp. MW5194]QRN02938.1 DUF1768 domain-containing protein [Legionella sp. MW5194]